MNNDKLLGSSENKILKAFLKKEVFEDALEKTYSFARLMSYYKCAIMEIETKFRVLNQEFSLMFDREPIRGKS